MKFNTYFERAFAFAFMFFGFPKGIAMRYGHLSQCAIVAVRRESTSARKGKKENIPPDRGSGASKEFTSFSSPSTFPLMIPSDNLWV